MVLVIPGFIQLFLLYGHTQLLFIGEQLRHRLHGDPLHIQVLNICCHVLCERSNLSLMSEIVLHCLGWNFLQVFSCVTYVGMTWMLIKASWSFPMFEVRKSSKSLFFLSFKHLIQMHFSLKWAIRGWITFHTHNKYPVQWETVWGLMAEKLTSLTQKRVTLWHVLAESYNICHYWS